MDTDKLTATTTPKPGLMAIKSHVAGTHDKFEDEVYKDVAQEVILESFGPVQAQAIDPIWIDIVADIAKTLITRCGEKKAQARVQRAHRRPLFKKTLQRSLRKQIPNEYLDYDDALPESLLAVAMTAGPEDWASL
jgi:hypothetical protein